MDDKEKKYSYSKLETYESCPFKYKLVYVDKLSCWAGNIATAFGTAIHETEEDIAKTIQANLPIDYVSLKNNLILKFTDIEHKYPVEYNSIDTKSSRTYRDKAYQYLEYGIYNLEQFMKAHPTYEIVGIEQKFCFKYDENHIFNGAIDRVFHDKETDRYLIQDIKSWAVAKNEKDLVTPLQFVIYVLAAKDLWGLTADQITCEYYLPLVDNGLVQPAGTAGFVDRGLKKLTKLFTAISEQEFAPKPSPLCNYCNYCQTNPDAPGGYKYLCPYYSIWNRYTRLKYDIPKHENNWEGLENHELILESYHKKYNITEDMLCIPLKK